MDAAGIAAFLVGAQQQNTRMAVATAMVKQQQKQDDALLGLLDSGLANGQALQAAAPEGMGQNLDVTV
jgi:mannose-1-phosphate guanylyltransferase